MERSCKTVEFKLNTLSSGLKVEVVPMFISRAVFRQYPGMPIGQLKYMKIYTTIR